jgi:DNA-binding NtrC family response regulator
VKYFIHRYGKELDLHSPSIQPEAISFLQSQPWPGNVRELENVIRQTLLAARPFGISLEHAQRVLAKSRKPTETNLQTHAVYIAELLNRAQSGDIHDAYSRMIADLEPELFKQAIQLAQGNQSKAARWLGVSRMKIREKILQFGLGPKREEQNKPQ